MLCVIVVVASVTNESSLTLAKNFFQHVLMKFGLCHSVVIHDGNPFIGDFVARCKPLDLNYDILVKRNHKGSTVENFHRFNIKTVAIEMDS